MATRTITGKSPGGYALKSTFDTLIIAATASVGGAGVTTTDLHATTISNLGAVHGTANGITLSDGGAITNGSTTNTTALIAALAPITVNQAEATLTNYAIIKSDPAVSNPGLTTTYGVSISLNAGGSVTNAVTGKIENGVSIAGGPGTVINHGTIGGSGSEYFYYGYPVETTKSSKSASVKLTAGGSVTNGDGAALIANGIDITGGVGTVVNNGTIRGPTASNKVGYYFGDASSVGPFSSSYTATSSTGYAVAMANGGTVTNGSEADTAASITNGISISGGAGTVVNHGTIGGPSSSISSGSFYFVYQYSEYGGSYVGYSTSSYSVTAGYSIRLTSGGTITNGSEANTTAKITNGISVSGAAATVTNFAVIDATAAGKVGISLQAGGDIVNGSKTDTTALIAGTTGIVLSGPGTVTNFGTITNGISISGGAGTVTNRGTIGGPLVFSGSGSVANFGIWNQSGKSSIGTGTEFINSGTLNLLGQFVNSGTITNSKGSTLTFGADVSITTDPAVKAGTFINAGLVKKTAGTGKSTIRTGTGTLTSSGVIEVQTGTLALTGSKVGITGAIKGAGTIEFGPGAATLGDGSSITTANFDIIGTGAQVTVGRILAYANDFSATSNTELTITAGDMLKLTGTASFAHDTVDGAGRLTTTGATTINDVTLGGTAQWYNAGVITETGGTLTVGDNAGHKAVFLNQATGVLNLAGNVGLGIGSATTSTFTNQGLLAKTAGGLSTISIAMVNTGTIEVASGTLDLQKAVTGTGKIKIDAGKVIQADAAVSAGQTVDFNGGNDKLVLTDAAHFAAKLQDFGAGDKLDLRQFHLATTTLSFSENAAHTQGVLTVTDGALQAKITLLGQYMVSGFHKSSDGISGGTFVTYTPQAAIPIAPPLG